MGQQQRCVLADAQQATITLINDAQSGHICHAPRELSFQLATYPNILFHFLPINSTSVDILNSSSLSHRLRHSNLTTASATRIDDLINKWPRTFSHIQSLFTGLLVSYSLAQAGDGVIYITTLFLLPNHCHKGCIFLTTDLPLRCTAGRCHLCCFQLINPTWPDHSLPLSNNVSPQSKGSSPLFRTLLLDLHWHLHRTPL